MWNSPLLENSSVSTFPWQQIDAVSDELFEMVIYIWFASKLQKRSYIELQVSSSHSSAPVKESHSPADKTFRTDSAEVTVRAPDKKEKTRPLIMCNTFVK
jgi:hypothetical protein